MESIPLHANGGKGPLVGVSFPSKPTDYTMVPDWAGKTKRTSDKWFVPAKNNPAAAHPPAPTPPGGTPAPTPPPFLPEKPQQAPWAGSSSGPPIYVHAHANPQGYAVTVNQNGQQVPVFVNGTTHGKIVEANQYYQQAAGADPHRPGVMMSCSSGNPTGTTAGDSAAYLHSQGEQRDWYAPTGTGIRWPGKNPDTSLYGVAESKDAQGNVVPGTFRKYGAPPPPAPTPAPAPAASNPAPPPSGGGTTP